jgi:hypothetical protein
MKAAAFPTLPRAQAIHSSPGILIERLEKQANKIEKLKTRYPVYISKLFDKTGKNGFGATKVGSSLS